MNQKKWEQLTFADDFMFGKIMVNPDICKEVLERILNIKIERIEYIERQKSLDVDYEAKSIRMDVYVKDGKGTVYNIEMQAANDDDLAKRSRYYQSIIDMELLDKGLPYEELNQSFVIFICNFDLFGKGRHIYTFKNLCTEDTQVRLEDETTKIFLNAKGTLDDASPELKAFLNYVSTGVPSDDTFVKRLDEEVKKARTNRKWRREYMKYHVNMMIAKRQGLKQGDILRQISQIRTIHDKNLSMDMYIDIFDIDLSMIEQIQQFITQHPDWNDEQIYDALFSKTDD